MACGFDKLTGIAHVYITTLDHKAIPLLTKKVPTKVFK